MSDVLVISDSLAGRADVLPPAFLPPAFVCSWRDCGPDAAWVHVAGELDVATSPQLERTLEQAQLQARLVVLDLRGLAFMDGTGVHAIADAGVRARQVARRLVVLRGPANVDRILMLSGGVADVELYDIDPVESPVHVLVRLAAAELAS